MVVASAPPVTAGVPQQAVAAAARPIGCYAFQYTADDRVLWRVLGGNHRELGRAAMPAPDVEGALLDLKRLGHAAHTADDGSTVERLLLRQPRGWVWELRLDGVPLAIARHAYDRRVRCHESAVAFLGLVVELGVPESPRVLDHLVRRAR